MELRQLRYFVAVAEELHFRRAAERLLISTPTLSQQVKAVEAEIGAPLLVRHSSGVTLTAAGDVLLREGRELLAAADKVLSHTRKAAGVTEPALRLGLLNGVPPALPARIEAAVAARGAELVMTGGTTADQVRLLAAGQTDLALLRAPVTLPKGLRQAPAAREELGILLSEHNLLAAKDAIPPEALAGRELIMFPRELSPGFHDEMVRALRDRGADCVLSDSAMGFQQVLAILPLRPDAVSLGSARAAGTPGLAWRPLAGPPLTVTYVMAWATSSRNALLPAVRRALTTMS
jgi:DNA-binding transcriptional LysR family regulator